MLLRCCEILGSLQLSSRTSVRNNSVIFGWEKEVRGGEILSFISGGEREGEEVVLMFHSQYRSKCIDRKVYVVVCLFIVSFLSIIFCLFVCFFLEWQWYV